ncbi:hypothetical protein [Desulfosporosinus shakirovi]|uniref:hypothetical protein n=1 Tax=Desulfosporosinus shakirovi TaxID=2885154 RepID=UPI001E36D821|nr:hypothetical protein [Desulfosporosinus sp. SRJS8]MCB8816673.1 hypothetical protein [Desulfosporosinus sp. SRJS8]
MRLFALIYNTFVWGLLTAIIAFNNQWLEMRINIGYIIPVIMFILITAVLIYKKPVIMTVRFTLLNLMSCFLLVYFIIGSKRLTVVPAAIIREAINKTDITFPAINMFLILCLGLGLIVIWLWKPKSSQ